MNDGVISKGVKCQMVREGDNLEKIVTEAILEETGIVNISNGSTRPIYYSIKDYDVIGITESVVARAQGNYVTVDEIAKEVERLYGKDSCIFLTNMIYSRNRFSMILKGIARAAKSIIMVMPQYDEVGNPSGVNQFTGVDIKEYYKEICFSENCNLEFFNFFDESVKKYKNILYCGLHDFKKQKERFCKMQADRKDSLKESGYMDEEEEYRLHTLADICSDKCEYGLLGSNKANEETIKLFPNKVKAKELCENIKKNIYNVTGKNVIVCVYGDGCFKDPVGGIWEFADPVTMPAYTDEEIIEGTPNEIKVKAFADDKYRHLSGIELTNAVKSEIEKAKGKSLVGQMSSQGTTPRMYRDLLASLMDLTSGSGDRCTPIVYITNYFRK